MAPRFPLGNKSSKKLLLFYCSLFLLGIIFVQLFSKKEGVEKLQSVVQKNTFSFKKQLLPDSIAASFHKRIAGFWTLSQRITTNQYLFDRIEVKANGYVWRVKKITYTLPSTKTIDFYYITNSFLSPFDYSRRDSSVLIFDVYTIRQSCIFLPDTCYNREPVDEAWYVHVKDSTLLLNQQSYKRYDSTDLTRFFPPGMISLVDKFGIIDCKSEKNQLWFIKTNLIADLQNTIENARDSGNAARMIKEYYFPLVLQPALARIHLLRPLAQLPFSFSATITWNGDMTDVKAQTKGMFTEKKDIDNYINREIATWKLSKLDKVGPGLNLFFQDTLRLKPDSLW